MADELDDEIRTNAEGPAKVSGDAGSVEQHKLTEQIEADRYALGLGAHQEEHGWPGRGSGTPAAAPLY